MQSTPEILVRMPQPFPAEIQNANEVKPGIVKDFFHRIIRPQTMEAACKSQPLLTSLLNSSPPTRVTRIFPESKILTHSKERQVLVLSVIFFYQYKNDTLKMHRELQSRKKRMIVLKALKIKKLNFSENCLKALKSLRVVNMIRVMFVAILSLEISLGFKK